MVQESPKNRESEALDSTMLFRFNGKPKARGIPSDELL